MNRKKIALFVLLILFALAVVWSFYAFPRQKTVSTLKYAPGQVATAPRPTATPAPKPTVAAVATPVSPSAAGRPATATDDRFLHIELLNQNQNGFKGYRRNIFKPVFIDEVKAMMRKAAAPKPLPLPPVAVPKVEPPPAAKVEQAPVAGQADVLKATLARFVFLGYVKKDNRKTIFLSKDKEIILVRKGDKFAGKYEAKNLTDQALTIVATDTGDETVIPLIENQPLSAAAK